MNRVVTSPSTGLQSQPPINNLHVTRNEIIKVIAYVLLHRGIKPHVLADLAEHFVPRPVDVAAQEPFKRRQVLIQVFGPS